MQSCCCRRCNRLDTILVFAHMPHLESNSELLAVLQCAVEMQWVTGTSWAINGWKYLQHKHALTE